MKMIYIIDFNGEKNRSEQLALCCYDYQSVFDHVVADLMCEAEYYQFSLKVRGWFSKEHGISVLYVDSDDEIGIEVSEDECSNIKAIMESDIDIVSDILDVIIIE